MQTMANKYRFWGTLHGLTKKEHADLEAASTAIPTIVWSGYDCDTTFETDPVIIAQHHALQRPYWAVVRRIEKRIGHPILCRGPVREGDPVTAWNYHESVLSHGMTPEEAAELDLDPEEVRKTLRAQISRLVSYTQGGWGFAQEQMAGLEDSIARYKERLGAEPDSSLIGGHQC
jgi:hypothetical protein